MGDKVMMWLDRDISEMNREELIEIISEMGRMIEEQQIKLYGLMDAPCEPIAHLIMPRECADMIRKAQIQAVVSLDQFAKMIERLD